MMKITALFTALLFLVGCVHFKDRPLAPEPNLAIFQARSLKDPDLLDFVRHNGADADLSKVWNAADLTLAAFFYQPELAVSRAQWSVVESELDKALEYSNPTLSVAPAFNSSTPSNAGVSPWVLGASLDYSIELPSKRRARVAEADFRARAAWLQHVEIAWGARVRVCAAMLDLHSARQRAALQRLRVEIQQARVGLLVGKQKLGGIAILDVRLAQQDLAAGRLALMGEEKREALAFAQLASAIGIPSDALHAITIDFNQYEKLPENIPAPEVWKQTLMNRADILGQLAQYGAAQARLQLEIARQYPDISIGPGYEFDQGDHKWGLNVSLTLPLLNRNQAAIETARRQREAEAERFNALQTRVLGALDQAMVDYAHSYRQFCAADEMTQENEERLQLLKKQADAGAVAHERVLEGRLDLNVSARQRLDAKIEAEMALGRLEREMQSPADLPAWQNKLTQMIDRNEESHEEL